ncbi:hypothetical protein NET02_07175 [Thermomicrobiaceae bacterium CFH 74404]|uniref:Uncharacterized protein n=1 Tax=Thermalbibacter longus TaxID=2951981 RepID=A0AA41WF25_9BACT|nr:hypothetical protein [Thermalbibacter longus]MCM8748918.1 hypothetical protein [Thermalbibacter longus]
MHRQRRPCRTVASVARDRDRRVHSERLVLSCTTGHRSPAAVSPALHDGTQSIRELGPLTGWSLRERRALEAGRFRR